MKLFRKYSIIFAVYAILLIIIPLLFIVIYAFSDSVNSPTLNVTIDNLVKATDPLYIEIIIRSLNLAIQTTLITLVIGYAVAYFTTKLSPRIQKVALVLFILPMWINVLLRTYAWKSILSSSGILNQFLELFSLGPVDILNTHAAVLIGMVYNFLPFMIFPIYVAISKIDEDLKKSARDLGCNEKEVFRKVTLPLSMPGVITGIIFVFTPSATSFIVPMYLGGGKFDLIGNIIERQFTVVGNWNFGSMLALLVLLVMMVTTVLMQKAGERYEV